MRAAAVRVLFVLLADAGPEGWCWRSPRELQAVLARSHLRQQYSLATILRSLNELRAAGFITWRHVLPNGRFPLRMGKGKASLVKWGQGRATETGGRVFMVDLDALTAPACQPRDRAARPEPPPMDDRTPPIIHDRPSDRLLVSSGDSKSRTEEATLDPAAAPLSEDTPPEGGAEQTGRDAPRERDSQRAAFGHAGHEASETPGCAARPATAPRELAERRAPPERRGGNEEHDPGQLWISPRTGETIALRFASEENAAAHLKLTSGHATGSSSTVTRRDVRPPPPPVRRSRPSDGVAARFGQGPPRLRIVGPEEDA